MAMRRAHLCWHLAGHLLTLIFSSSELCVIHVGSQFLDGDGTFPNHIPNPENKEAMEEGCRMVTDNGADLGVLFDTDVDRSAVVAADGAPINSNRYIALMAYIALRCITRFTRSIHLPYRYLVILTKAWSYEARAGLNALR